MNGRQPSAEDRPEHESFERAWHDRFVEFASVHDDDAGIAGWSTSGLETRLRFFRGLWSPAPRDAIFLDVGCGAGTYTRWLAEQGLRAIGVDYSLPALAKARDRSARGLSYCAADAGHLPFREATFDGALCFGLLQAVSDSTLITRELARVLKPGASLWIDALNRGGLAARATRAGRRLRGRPMHLRYESPKVLAAILEQAGFDGLTRHWLPIVPSRIHRLQPLVESRLARILISRVPPVGELLSHAFLYSAMRADRASTATFK
jgi:ubiquinone/menaquinone biosynthesis C-methylase UbiE